MRFKVVIPARYASTRLPGKPLVLIADRMLLDWVHERALGAGADEVLIATDDERIATAARGFGAHVVMTSASHASGTDRIAEVARARGWGGEAVVVNVQGDEPLLPSTLIGQVAGLLAENGTADIATLYTPVLGLSEFLDPNTVKIVTDANGRALYFSRAPIPFDRAAVDDDSHAQFEHAKRHIGLYAYRVSALLRLSSLPPASLERTEMLEQLRALANGFEIRAAQACATPGPDVNSPADLGRVAALLSR